MRALRLCEILLEVIVAALMLALVVMVFTNVVLRFAFSSGIVVTEELSRITLSLLVFIGSVLALIQHGHIAMTMMIGRFSPGLKKIAVLATGAIMVYCNWLLADGSWVQAKLNFSSNYPLSGLPSETIYVVAAICGLLMTIIILARMLLILVGRMPPEQFFQSASANLGE